MAEEIFEIKSEGIDVKEIMNEIEKRVEEKKQQGVYDKYNLEAITELKIEELKEEREFLDYYLRALKRSWDVDINDFEILPKGGILGRPLVLFKKLIWKCLKFYTYRLFSQQREFNSQVVAVLEGINKKVDNNFAEIKKILEKR